MNKLQKQELQLKLDRVVLPEKVKIIKPSYTMKLVSNLSSINKSQRKILNDNWYDTLPETVEDYTKTYKGYVSINWVFDKGNLYYKASTKKSGSGVERNSLNLTLIVHNKQLGVQ